MYSEISSQPRKPWQRFMTVTLGLALSFTMLAGCHRNPHHTGSIVKDDLADIQTLSTAISDADLNVAQREQISNSLYEFCNRSDHEAVCRQELANGEPITYTSKDMLGYAAKVMQRAADQDERFPKKAAWDANRSIDLLHNAFLDACGSESRTQAKLQQAGL